MAEAEADQESDRHPFQKLVTVTQKTWMMQESRFTSDAQDVRIIIDEIVKNTIKYEAYANTLMIQQQSGIVLDVLLGSLGLMHHMLTIIEDANGRQREFEVCHAEVHIPDQHEFRQPMIEEMLSDDWCHLPTIF